MTYSDEDRLDSLKYRLLAPTNDPGAWGHEYVRHLALEIGTEHARRVRAAGEIEGEEGEGETKEGPAEDLLDLALSLVPFFLKHNAEADAADLLFELDTIERIPEFLDEDTFARVCLYMVRYVVSPTCPLVLVY